MQQAIVDPIVAELEALVADNRLPDWAAKYRGRPRAAWFLISKAFLHCAERSREGREPNPVLADVNRRAVPILLGLVHSQQEKLQVEQAEQALELYTLYVSRRWEAYASSYQGTPSWKGFLDRWLPNLKYTTAENYLRVMRVIHEKAGYGVDAITRFGLSKLATIVRAVEREYDTTGEVSPQTRLVIETGSHRDFLYFAAQERDGQEMAVGYRLNTGTGEIEAYYDGLPYPLGRLNLLPPPQGEGYGHLSAAIWKDVVLEDFIRKLRPTVIE